MLKIRLILINPLALKLIIWGLIDPLPSINLLSVNVRHEDNIKLSINGAHYLLLPLIVWFANELHTLDEFDVLKLRDLMIKLWHLNLLHNGLLDGAISSILLDHLGSKERFSYQ